MLSLPLPLPDGADVVKAGDPQLSRCLLTAILDDARRTLKAFTGSLMIVPEFEAKIAFGLHLEAIAELVNVVDERLGELPGRRSAPKSLDHDGLLSAIFNRREGDEIVSAIYD